MKRQIGLKSIACLWRMARPFETNKQSEHSKGLYAVNLTKTLKCWGDLSEISLLKNCISDIVRVRLKRNGGTFARLSISHSQWSFMYQSLTFKCVLQMEANDSQITWTKVYWLFLEKPFYFVRQWQQLWFGWHLI